MIQKKLFILAAMTGLLFTTAGWDFSKLFTDPEELQEEIQREPECVISIHEIVRYPKAESLERKVDCFNGASICVNVNSFLHSRNVKKIDPVPRPDEPGYYDLRLTLDNRGYLLWSSTAAQFKGRKMAFVIDGLCYRLFTPTVPNYEDDTVDRGDRTVIVAGPFDEVIAKRLSKFSESNYKIFNG